MSSKRAQSSCFEFDINFVQKLAESQSLTIAKVLRGTADQVRIFKGDSGDPSLDQLVDSPERSRPLYVVDTDACEYLHFHPGDLIDIDNTAKGLADLRPLDVVVARLGVGLNGERGVLVLRQFIPPTRLICNKPRPSEFPIEITTAGIAIVGIARPVAWSTLARTRARERREAASGSISTIRAVLPARHETHCAPTVDDAEWPEFRSWYALTMEEQRIYAEEAEDDHDRLLDDIDHRRQPLEKAMLERRATTPAQLACLAVIELRRMEKYSKGAERGNLDLAEMHDDHGHWCQGAHLVRATIEAARAEGLLAGIMVHGLRDEALC